MRKGPTSPVIELIKPEDNQTVKPPQNSADKVSFIPNFQASVVPSLPKFKPPIQPVQSTSNNIFDSVYRPSSRMGPIQSPLMKDGAMKVLDPVTGVFKIYSDAPAQPKRNVPSATTPPTAMFPERPKPHDKSEKINKQKPIVSNLKRTMSIPNIANLSEDISSSSSESGE